MVKRTFDADVPDFWLATAAAVAGFFRPGDGPAGGNVLFRTVYGPELEAVHRYIVTSNQQGRSPQRANVHTAFMLRSSDRALPSTQSIDDALAFLCSARLIEEKSGFEVRAADPSSVFAVKLFKAMRRIELNLEKPEHPVDPLYTLLLSELFIKPDRLFVKNVHIEANRLRQVREAGGLTKEKIQAWKRVMEFLGAGRRFAGGFLCTYMPTLVREILQEWREERGVLHSFFTDCFGPVVPYARSDGELARAVEAPLNYLAQIGEIELFPLQDSPARPYFGSLHFKGMARRNRCA